MTEQDVLEMVKNYAIAISKFGNAYAVFGAALGVIAGVVFTRLYDLIDDLVDALPRKRNKKKKVKNPNNSEVMK